MDFKKFLSMMSEAESTAEKDDKAEKAGKKVAKDIEYDEGHKGKDDEKAEKAGEKVKKDIEYDDKKDKKSLKDWFEIIDKNMLAEAEQLTIEPAKQNTQVIRQGGKTIGTVTNPSLAANIKAAIGKGEMSLAGKDIKEDDLDEKAKNPYAIGMAQAMKSTGDKPPLKKSTIVKAHDIAKKVMKKEAAEDNPDSAMLDEKWAGDAEIKPTGQYKDKTVAELKAMLAKLHKSGPHDKDSPAAKKQRQINFALRAKGGWKKGEGAAMKEAEIPHSGPDYGAGLGAGRSQATFEGRAKADDKAEKAGKKVTKDLEYDMGHKGKDDAKAEKAGKKVTKDIEYDEKKKAAADKKKQKVKESMNTLEAAYHEGKSHGLSKHGYSCRYNEGSEEHKRYHDGFKEGLDECYGLMPNRGLVVSEVESEADVVDNMASYGADEGALGEMDKGDWMKHKAKTTPGDTFKAFGQTFKDKDVLETGMAFESLEKQLNALLESEETVAEGLSVNMSQGLNDGMGGQGSDSVSVTATDDDAAKLLDFIKQVGLGGLGAAASAEEPKVVAQISDYGAPKFQGHDDMVGLMKLAGGDDYKDEEGHDHGDMPKAKMCGTHELPEGECGCGEGKEMVDEVESEDQMEYQVAEDDGEGYEQGQEAAAQIDAALAVGSENEKAVHEAGDGGEESSPEAAGAVAAADAAEEEDEAMSEEKKLDEWANDAGKDGTEQTFERDIEFMTKVIAGGLNKPKVTGQTTIPVIAGQDARTGDEDVNAWKKLAGIAK